ncbi:hypothetical protein BT93_C2029 [Corymbia citriodora subsp. variegata]|nr:hypothetical protein BT93_C2029 [Corymbia citriodora subsp. variegata]
MVVAVGVPIEVAYLEYSSAVDKIAVCSLPLWINRPNRGISIESIVFHARLTLSAELGSTSGKDCYPNVSPLIDFLI